MITDIPKVKISGINYPVYAIDFNWGGADSPSTLSIDFVNSDGEYNRPSLQTETLTKIKIGSFWEFNGYPVKFRESYSERGRVLTVDYIDSSMILDHIFVGLNGVHGIAKKKTITSFGNIQTTIPTPTVSGTFNNIVLVGNYVDPCEGQEDGFIDPCNPCVTQQQIDSLSEENQNKKVDCVQERSIRILDVVYTINELIQALMGAGIKFNTPIPTTDTSTFYGRHTGTAREVLKAWSNELGFTFFWDNDSITFVDLKLGISINDTNFYDECSLINRSYSESIENNTYLGNIYYFGAEGEIKDYDCTSNNFYKLSLIPITLKDLFWSNGTTGINGQAARLSSYIAKYYCDKDTPYSDPTDISGLQLACLFSKYSENLRDLSLLYEYYNVSTIDENLVGRSFPLLGIKKVISVGKFDDAGADNGMKRAFYNTYDAKFKDFVKKSKGKILKVIYNKAWHDRFKAFEKALAEDFIGRYWISFLNNGDKFDISSPDGSPQFFKAGSPANLPFMKLIPESVASQSAFLQRLMNSSNALNRDGTASGATSSADSGTLDNSFILLDRQVTWEPTENSEIIKTYDSFFSKYSPFFMDPFRSNVKEKTEDALKEEEAIIIAYDRPHEYSISTSNQVFYHPIENNSKNIQTEIDGINTYYGLRSSVSKKYVIDIKIKQAEDGGNGEKREAKHHMDIYFPVQAHDDFGVEFSGYTVILTPQNEKMNHHWLLEKKEVIIGDCPPKISIGGTSIRDTVGVDINFKDLTTSITTILTSSGAGCSYSTSAITNLINEFKIKTTRQKKVRNTVKDYTIHGFPTRTLSLSDGVSSFNIRYAADGMTTTLSFNNTPPITRSQEILDKELENNILRRLLKHKSLSSAKKIII